MTFPVGIPVTIIKRTRNGRDSMGNDVWTETRTDTRGVFNPGSSVELVQGQDVLTIQPTLVVPVGTAIASTDAVEVPTGGDPYEVDGAPAAPQSPFTGWQPGVVVRLRRVTG